MEALSKIGEYFFEDGRVSEEERLRVYREYKAKMRAQKQGASKKQSSGATDPPTAKVKKAKGSGTRKTKASKNTGVSSGARQSATTNTNTNTNTNTRTTHTRTTRTGEATDEMTTESGEDSPSESSSTDDLESMIPETVCADLSIRSVSTKSVISESGTDSGSHRDHHSVEESVQSRSLESERRSRSRSRSTRTGRSRSTAGRSRTMSGSLRERDEEDDDDDDDDDEDDDTSCSEHDKQPRGPVKKDRNRSTFSLHRIISPFRLGSARSASVTTARQDTITATDTATIFDEQGTVERRMVEQLLHYISSGDHEDDSVMDDSHSSASSQDSLTQTSSINNNQPNGISTSQLGRKPSKASTAAKGPEPGSHSLARKQSATKSASSAKKDKGTLPTFDVHTANSSNAGFEAGLGNNIQAPSVTSTDVFSNITKSVKASNTMTSANPRAIHGWVEDDTLAGTSGLGNRIELAISADANSGKNDGPVKSDSDPGASSALTSAKEMNALDNNGLQQHGVAPTFSVEVPDSSDKPKIKLLRKMSPPLQLTKATTGSNIEDDGIQGFRNALVQAGRPPKVPEQKPPRPTQTALNGPSQTAAVNVPTQKRVTSRVFGQFFGANGSKAAKKTPPPPPPPPRGDNSIASSAANSNSRSRSLPIPTMEAAIEKARSAQMEAAIEKARSAQLHTAPSGPHQLLDIIQKNSHDRAPPKCPPLSQPENTQSNNIFQMSSLERPPQRPSSPTPTRPPPTRQSSHISVLKGVTVTTTCSGSMDNAEASDMQEYIEVTYDLAALKEEESSSIERISSSVASPKNDGEEQEPLVEKVHKDVEGVYTKSVPHKQIQEEIPIRKKQKTSFMRRLLSSKKKNKKKKADNIDKIDDSDRPNDDQPRHIIGTTSVFSEGSQKQKNAKAERQHSLGDPPQKVAREVSALPPLPSVPPSSTDLPAQNGFMKAMENLKFGPADYDTAAALPGEQADQEDNSEHVRFAPNDVDEQVVQNEDGHYVEEHHDLHIPPNTTDESPIKRLLRSINRGRDKENDHKFAASPGPTGVEIISEFGKKPHKKKWARSISLPRSKRDKELASDAMGDSREDAGMAPLSSNSMGDRKDVGVTPLPFKLPKATRSKVTVTEDHDQSVESIYDEEPYEEDVATIDNVNPWCSIHPNYTGRQHPNVLPADDSDGKRRKTRAKLVKAFAKKLVEERQAQLETSPDDSSEDPCVIDHPEFEEYAEVGLIEETQGRPKKKGLGKIKSTIGRLFRTKGTKTRRGSMHPTNSLEDLRDQSVGDTIEYQYDDVGPIAPSEQGTDNTFLMQHQMLLQSRNPTWKQPMPRGRGSTSLDRTFPGYESTTVDHTYATLENETQQAKLQRVLGRREEKKRAKQKVDNSILDVHPQQHVPSRKVEKLLKSVSSSSSASSIEDTTNGGDSTTYADTSKTAYSIQNQRVLNTLRLLHAVKKRKRREERNKRSERMQDCSDFMDPLIDGIEEAACGRYQAK